MPENSSNVCKNSVVDLYERHAGAYNRNRGRSLQERAWLDRFLSHVRPGGTVLDVGCGMGDPIARYLISRGFGVVGVDASPSMIERCRARFPDSEWIVADMRELQLNRRFEGILAWDSFFHLGMDDQRCIFPRFASYAREGAPLMFTSGPEEGIAFVVAPTCRGRGVARGLLSGLLDLPELWPVKRLTGAVEPENMACRRALVAAGFTIASIVDGEGTLRVERRT